MADDLDLSSLASGPVPALADPGAVRSRGEQRRQRTRSLVAGSAAFLLLAGAGTAITLSRDPSPHSLQIGSTPTPTPFPSVEPTAEPTTEPTEPTPTVGPELLLQPADATFVANGRWDATTPRDQAFALLVVCPTEDIGGVAGRYRTLDGPGETSVLTQVIRYPDGGGTSVVASLRQAVSRCPSRPADSEDGKATESHQLEESTAGDVVVVRETSRDCDTCAARVSYWVVVADLSHVSYVKVPGAEQPRLGAWADAARFRLVCADASCMRGDDPTGAEPGSLSAADRVRLDGIGPVTIGMSLASAEAAAGQRFTTFKDDLGNGCGFVSPRSGSPDLDFMVVHDTVVRIDVREGSTTRTGSGIGIGATEDEVEAAYPGRVVVRPHAYTGGHYLRVVSNDGLLVLVFETDGTRVTMIRSGTADAAEAVEGCA